MFQLLFLIVFLGLIFLLVKAVERRSITKAVRRLASDQVVRVIEGAFHNRLCGDLCLTRSQLVYVAMAVKNEDIWDFVAAGGGIVGAAIEAQRKVQRDEFIASFLDFIGKVRAEERDLPLSTRLTRHPFCMVFDRSQVKAVEWVDDVIKLRCVKPKSLKFVFKNADHARQADLQLREWMELSGDLSSNEAIGHPIITSASSARPRSRVKALVTVSVLSAIAAGGAYYWRNASFRQPAAKVDPASDTNTASFYVNTASLNLRLIPAPDATIVARLTKNTQLSMLGDTKRSGGRTWVKVRASDREGWVDARLIRKQR